MPVMLGAGIAGLFGLAVTFWTPEPSSAPGRIAVGLVCALAVVVARQALTLRDRDDRLRKIEDLLGERLDHQD